MLPSASRTDVRRRSAIAPPRRGLILAAMAIVCSAAWAVENRADEANSGWAVGKPATTILQTPHSNPELRGILHHVLEQSHVPILRDAGPALNHPAGSPRLAERTPSVEGWRSTSLPLSPLLTPAPHAMGPGTSAPSWPASLLDPNGSTRAAAAEQEKAAVAEPALEQDAHQETILQFRPPSTESSAAHGSATYDAATEVQSDAVPAAPDPQTDRSDPSIPFEPATQPAPRDEPSLPSSNPAPPAHSSLTPTPSPPHPDAEHDASAPTNDQAADSSADPTEAHSAEADAPNDEAPQVAPPLSIPIVKAPPPPLTRQLINLRSRVRSVLKGYYRKPLNSREHDPWEVMHGMLAYGLHSRILQHSPRGEPITAVGWLCYNQPCKRLTLMYVTPEGELRAKHGVGLQGHMGQLLAMLAQCNVSPDYPIHVGRNEFTIRDLIEAEKKTCYPKSELTFKLIALQHYLDLNDKWVNDQGLEWDIPRLVREELAQPIRGAACGGTHRLSGLSLTVKARQRRGEPLDGEYSRAAEFIQKYHNYAFRLQNRDGSLSTEWFRGRGDEDDDDRRIKTTGHILEWLCYSLSDEELRQQRTVRAVAYLANLMYSNYDHDWEVGPRSHATHALVLYDARVFRPFDKEGDVASFKPQPSTANRSQQRTSGRR